MVNRISHISLELSNTECVLLLLLLYSVFLMINVVLTYEYEMKLLLGTVYLCIIQRHHLQPTVSIWKNSSRIVVFVTGNQ